MQKEIKAQSFVVKTSGLLKSDRTTTKTFYFAENFDEIDSTNVSGVLINVGQIKQTVDFYTGQSSYGGFNIEVLRIQDTVDDLLDDFYFYNRDIYIYYHIEGQDRDTATPDLQQVYKGKIENAIVKHDRVLFTVINDRKKLERQFPRTISNSDAGTARGKAAQYVYGTHSMNYGQLVAGNGSGLMTNNMVKALYCGIISGKHRWIVAGNGADITIADYTAVWFWDAQLNRYVQLADSACYTSGTDAEGNIYIDIEAPATGGYIAECFDYIMPDYAESQGAHADWSNVPYILDGDWDTASTLDVAPGAFIEELVCFFPHIPDYTITEQKIYCRTWGDERIDNFTLTGHGATLDVNTLLSYGATEFSDTIIGTPPLYVGFTVTDASVDATAHVYYLFMRLKHQMTNLNDMYVECSNSITTQREIISDICTTVGATFTDNSDVAAITMHPVFYDQRQAISHIMEVAKQGACVAMIDGNNEITVDEIDMSATADKTLDIGDIEIESVVIGESAMRDLVNDMEVNFNYDNYTRGMTVTLDDQNSISDDIYGTWESSINADFITDSTNANALLDYYVNGATATFFTELRPTVEFYTRDIRGTVPYDGSGNFHPLIELELGDHFSLPAALDNYLTCNGESWSGMVFKIIGYGIEAGRLWLKGIYIRTV